MNRSQATLVLVSLAGVLQNTSAQEHVFRTSTHLVQINVIAQDKNGPVANLTKDDFLLTDAGQPRSIAVFSVSSTLASSPSADALPANTFSNRAAAPPSVTVIVLDRLNTLTGAGSHSYEEHPRWLESLALANARQDLIRFVSTLDPKDRVAIYSLSASLAVLSDFTNDRARLQAVLEKYQPVSITRREDVDPLPVHTPVPCCFDAAIDQDRQALAGLANRSRTETTMLALASIAAHVAGIPGRKNLVWLTADLPFPGGVAARAVSRANLAVYPVDARGLLPAAPIDNGDPGALSVFGGIARSSRQGSEPPGLPTMQDLAAETGGRAFINTNDLAGAIRAAVEDAAVTYTLGFYPDEDSLDGKFHELRVHVKRPGIEARYPKHYLALTDALSPQLKQREFQRALESPLESATIPLLARVARSNDPKSSSLTIAGTVDIRNLQLEQDGAMRKGAVEIYIYQQDTAGRVLDKSRTKLNLQLTAENYVAYLKSGVFFRQTIAAKADLSRLRILAGDPITGAIGSLIIPASDIK
jgi:VWFA-related protein